LSWLGPNLAAAVHPLRGIANSPNRVFMSKQFIRFLIVSGIAAAANIGSRILLGLWMGYVPSIVLAYIVGMTTAFILNRALVFTGAGNPVHHQVFWFVVVNAAAIVQTLLASVILARLIFPLAGFTWHAKTIAHIIGVGIPAITSYLGHKRLTFRDSQAPAP
jgi:putative flippase GtrA